jgi:hypothetical protein
MLMPAKGMELPSHVDWRLRNEFNCHMVAKSRDDKDSASVDAVYVTSDKPHQLSLISDVDTRVKRGIDAMYVTRFQKERWAEKSQEYPTIDSRFLKDRKFSKTSLLHPLPRVGELDISLDSDPRAAYFRQAAYGVPIRMALIALVLGLDREQALKRYEGGFPGEDRPLYDQPAGIGISCPNKNCIVHDASEGKYARNRFHVIAGPPVRLRCYYCEADIENFVIANKRTKHYDADTSQMRVVIAKHEREVLAYGRSSDAEAAGFSLPKRRRKAASV